MSAFKKGHMFHGTGANFYYFTFRGKYAKSIFQKFGWCAQESQDGFEWMPDLDGY
ncbi:hypothetical protein RvVAR0630_41050 [Agrobacterium vitis]|nr:hypothetical protein RvVAR0630_41050 [Agrobacterium vitis]